MTCPTCRAPWRETPECPRCGSDLTAVMRTAAAAWRHRRAALAALSAGRDAEALGHAREALALQATEEGAALVFVARVVHAGRSA